MFVLSQETTTGVRTEDRWQTTGVQTAAHQQGRRSVTSLDSRASVFGLGSLCVGWDLCVGGAVGVPVMTPGAWAAMTAWGSPPSCWERSAGPARAPSTDVPTASWTHHRTEFNSSCGKYTSTAKVYTPWKTYTLLWKTIAQSTTTTQRTVSKAAININSPGQWSWRWRQQQPRRPRLGGLLEPWAWGGGRAESRPFPPAGTDRPGRTGSWRPRHPERTEPSRTLETKPSAAVNTQPQLRPPKAQTFITL